MCSPVIVRVVYAEFVFTFLLILRLILFYDVKYRKSRWMLSYLNQLLPWMHGLLFVKENYIKKFWRCQKLRVLLILWAGAFQLHAS